MYLYCAIQIRYHMKKSKLKQLVKEARKSAKKDIELKLVSGLREVTATLAVSTKKLDKEIAKGAKQLAKKIGKELQFDTTSFAENKEEVKASEVVEATPAPKVKAAKKEVLK